MDKSLEFKKEVEANIAGLGADTAIKKLTLDWQIASARHKYSYNFTWMGRPIIQYPQDMMAMHEIIWQVKPDLIIETGVAHGGSLVFSASMLELIGGPGRVVGIDIDIRQHNRAAIEAHPMFKRITLIQGSSVAETVVAQVRGEEIAATAKQPLVILDSNHTHAHVAEELRCYSPFVRKGGYLVVMDTIIEDSPADYQWNRDWGKGNNPKTAVHEFLRSNDRFKINASITDKLLITVAPDGYLECVKD